MASWLFSVRKVLWGRHAQEAQHPVDPSAPGPEVAELQALVQRLAGQASHLGQDAALTRGALEDTQQVVVAQVAAMQTLMQQREGVAQAQLAISEATHARPVM